MNDELKPGQHWKVGNEMMPYHPSASHVDPSHRDGWNACFRAFEAARAEQEGEAKFVMPKLTPEQLAVINAPLVQSLLYDIDLMPEQIRDAHRWGCMLAVCRHMQAAMRQGVAKTVEPPQEEHHENWQVQVSAGDQTDTLVIICSDWLSGKADLTDKDVATIRHTAKHLLSFAGDRDRADIAGG